MPRSRQLMPRKIFTLPAADVAWLAMESKRMGLSEAGMVRLLIRLARIKMAKEAR